MSKSQWQKTIDRNNKRQGTEVKIQGTGFRGQGTGKD
jgi:hypothetical protein